MKLIKIFTDHDHSNKSITIQEFHKLTAQNFASRIAQANLASKSDIDALVKKRLTINYDDKLKTSNKNVTSNKIKHAEAEKKVTYLTNKMAQISEKGYDFC